MGGHGGKRRGAGRKPGGGLAPGKTLRTEARALLAEIVGTSKDPLMVAINLAADETKPDALRLEAALGASRYLHPTLSAQAVAHYNKPADANSVLPMLLERIGRLTASPAVIEHSAPDAQQIEAP